MWSPETSAFVAAVAQVATVLVAVAAAVFAGWQVLEARRAREHSPAVRHRRCPAEPRLDELAHSRCGERGTTLAKDVKIKFDPPLTTTVKDNRLVDSVLIRDGIAAMPPGRRVETLFDLSHDRLAQRLPMRYRVTVSFRDYRGHQQESLPYDIDLSSLYDLEVVGEKRLHDLVKEVEALRKEIANWRDGGRGLLIRRPADVQRDRADARWQYALTGEYPSLAHPGLRPGWA